MSETIISSAIQFILTSGVIGFLIKHYIGKIEGISDKINKMLVDVEVLKRDLVQAISIRSDFQADHDKMVLLMERVETAFKDINAQHQKIREQDAKLEMVRRKFGGN